MSESDAGPSLSTHEATQRVLRTDFALGIGGAVLGYAEAGNALLGVAHVTVAVGLLTAVAVAVVEHDAVPGVYPEVAALASLVLLAGVVLALLGLSGAATTVVLAGALSGFGVGLLGNRIVYGLVYAVPAYRLARVRE